MADNRTTPSRPEHNIYSILIRNRALTIISFVEDRRRNAVAPKNFDRCGDPITPVVGSDAMNRGSVKQTSINGGRVVREDVTFQSGGAVCAAWLYRPESAETARVPAVVMAHGFAAQRAFGLERYAKRFAKRGLAVLLFDYRHFGDSEGEPRDLVDHRRQRGDWHAAIEHARSIDGIDADSIGLWGSSYSGGHVITAAASDSAIKAVVAQVPMVDVLRAARVGPSYVLQAVGHIVADYVAVSYTHLRAHET